MRFLIRLLVTAAALWVAVRLVPGIEYQGHWAGLLAVALVFGVVNAFVRPILFLLTCPLVVITLGLFVFVLNGLMLWLTAAVSEAVGIDFAARYRACHARGTRGGVVSAVLNLFVGEPKQPNHDDT